MFTIWLTLATLFTSFSKGIQEGRNRTCTTYPCYDRNGRFNVSLIYEPPPSFRNSSLYLFSFNSTNILRSPTRNTTTSSSTPILYSLVTTTETSTTPLYNAYEVDKSDISCEVGWFTYGRMCYRLGGKRGIGKLTREEASQHCRKEYSGNLVTIDSKELQDFLVTFLLLDVRSALYIGLQDVQNETIFFWDDGTSLRDTVYTDWDKGEPSGSKMEHEDCTEMRFRFGDYEERIGWWNDIGCNDEKQYICQKQKSKVKWSRHYLDPRFCSNGQGWSLRDSCYYIVTNESLSWWDAETYCADKFNGHLATIGDFTVNLFLKYVMKQERQFPFWIGIKIKEEFQQRWTSGWYVSFQNFTDDRHSMEGCATLFEDGSWENIACNKPLAFICEYTTAQPLVLQPPPEEGVCPPGEWRDLGSDRCYYVHMKTTVTWPEANFMCLREGGTLASIHSMKELLLLQTFMQYFKAYVYIGFFRHKRYGDNFTWADNSVVDFDNWATGQPSTESQQCTEVKTDSLKWNDISCTTKLSFICTTPKLRKHVQHAIPGGENSSCSTKGRIGEYALVGMGVCALIMSVLVGVVVYFCRGNDKRIKKTSHSRPKYRSSELVIKEAFYENVD